MEVNSTVIVLLIVLIVLLVVSLLLFVAIKYLRRLGKKREAERYRGKSALLPIANPHSNSRSMTDFAHSSLSIDGGESFRQSFYRQLCAPTSSTTNLTVPEIRITFPDEDLPPMNPSSPGQRTSRVVVVQVGESGAAYVTPPPAYDGFHDIDMSTVGGLKEKR